VDGKVVDNLLMSVMAFKTGSATVDYSWRGTQSGCCSGTERCHGEFTAELVRGSIVDIGLIPRGKRDLLIELTAEQDLDIQLYDTEDTARWEEGKAIIAWCRGVCNIGIMGNNNGGPESIDYHGVGMHYSGWRGVDGQKGHEWVRLEGRTNRRLSMKVFAFRAGTVHVRYSYFEKDA